MLFRSNSEADDYKHAAKRAKHGLRMVMDGLKSGDTDLIFEGVEKAWDNLKEMCEISDEMEDRYSERRNDDMERRGYGSRHYDMRDHEWNERDDEWMERRMRDSRGRFR